MHVTSGEKVYEESDECDKADVNSCEVIHRESEIRTKIPDANPRPKMSENRLRRTKRAAVSE
jgi:hypothetical protein